MANYFKFKIQQKLPRSLARAGIISTPNGDIETPAFIIGGTKATVKGLTNDQIKASLAQAILVNTYHLMLQPGVEVLVKSEGINNFMGWDKPTFSDSGGFQVFSLGMAFKKGLDLTSSSIKGDPKHARHTKSQLAQINDDGATFRSHLDGTQYYITPEISMQLQHKIGANIHMAFDELTSPLASNEYIKTAMDRTHQWAKRSLNEHKKLNLNNTKKQALFGVVQGARIEQYRKESAQFLNSLDFDGFGIGGIFEPQEIMQVLEWTNNILDPNRPRHLLGMGSGPIDLFLGVEMGIDTFDCVAPTRQARNGALYTYEGRINIKNSRFKDDFGPIDPDCSCDCCLNYTKAYLNHLFHAHEMLGPILGSIHNEYFVISTVDKIRQSILDGTFYKYKKDFILRYYQQEIDQF
jgi:queuine tRNA-ribosyltransferase